MSMLNAFVDELEKMADAKTYPISRYLTSPSMQAITGAGLGIGQGIAHGMSAGATIPITAALSGGAGLMRGAAGGIQASLGRLLGAGGMAGRLARGGKGLMGHEKTLLAQMSGMSREELESVLARIAKKNEGMSTSPLPRALTTKYNPFNIPGRLIGARGFAGRAATGGKKLTPIERGIIDQLKREKWLRRGKIGGLVGGGATAAGVGLKQLLGSSSD